MIIGDVQRIKLLNFSSGPFEIAGSERAGKRAAAIQSLFATAKLNGIEPAARLKDTLETLPVWTMRRIDELLPIKPAA